MEYLITIYNSSDVLVYKEVIQADDETRAVIEVLKTRGITIYSGDKITIETLED